MAEREIVRTMPLERPIYDGAEISELEFSEPTARLMRELEFAREKNSRANKPSQFQSQTFVLLKHVTGVDASALETMSFADMQRASEIASQLTGLEDDEEDEPSSGKS